MRKPAKKTPSLPALDRSAPAPLQHQLYERIRTAVSRGTLQPGDRVASARSLASELSVARGTVESAYARLVGDGYLVARGPAGTVVAPRLPHTGPQSTAQERGAEGDGDGRAPSSFGEVRPLQLGIPALDAFPRKLWARLAARRIRAQGPADLVYGEPKGHRPLREAIAAYLAVARGVACDSSQVFVTGGYRATLALIERAVLTRLDEAWVEDPGHLPTRELLLDAGTRVVSIPVDAEGLQVEEAIRAAPAARLAIVTPSHQAPLGVSMSLRRRQALLEWAIASQAWIVEDDYDGEFHYAGPPLPSLKSIDTRHRVIYAGSFSKVLYPGLSLGYVVVPESLRASFEHATLTYANGAPQLTQAIVADFIRDGHFSLHLKKMRLLYARRRALLVQALTEAFGDTLQVDLADGGMHLIARFSLGQRTDVDLVERANLAGLYCSPLSARSVRTVPPQGVIMGFTNVATATQARQIARRLRKALLDEAD